jgi:peptidoglycan/xylan/chitin deacetylase (PgdA/CDA1 family)
MSHERPCAASERLPYEPIGAARRFALPAGVRIAVWTIVNVEHWQPDSPMPRTVLPPPMGQPLLPDIPNWCWHEYGMRVGFWRLLQVLQARAVKASCAVNGSALAHYPEACAAAHAAGWEFMGHGWMQRPMHRVEDQAASIRQTLEAIRALTGRAPRGWESPGLAERSDTLDLLAEAGIEYVADWVLDDQPVPLRTRAGPIIALPYTVELNDVVMFAVQNHTAAELWRRGCDQFDRLWREGEHTARVMAISLHPYLTGAPHRIRYLEALYEHIGAHSGVLMCTGEEILDLYRRTAAA